jgi:hypothetical protein
MTEKSSESFASTPHAENAQLQPKYETFHPDQLRQLLKSARYQRPEPALEHDPRFEYFELVTISNDVEKTVDTYKIEKEGRQSLLVRLRKAIGGRTVETEQPRRIERITVNPEGRFEIFVEGKVDKNGALIPQKARLLKGPRDNETSLIVETDVSKQEVTGRQKIESLDQKDITAVFREGKAPSQEDYDKIDWLAREISVNFGVNVQIKDIVDQVLSSVDDHMHPRMTAEELIKNPVGGEMS